jgi:radical SAM superfamily enzyme YgiQ (UPF0313 family)
MKIGLINANRRGAVETDVPPVPPIGLEYLADGLEDDGHEVSLLDLCFAKNSEFDNAIAEFVDDKNLLGVTFRNLGIDNLWMTKDQFYVDDLRSIVQKIKSTCSAPVVLGGQGFSIYPKEILGYTGADYGVQGPGENSLRTLAADLKSFPRGSILRGVSDSKVVHKRHLIDYQRYIERGGIPAIQTKNGCPMRCSFCVEAGKRLRCRDIDAVMTELKIILQKRAPLVFIADAEFNADVAHAVSLCKRILEESLHFQWSTYLNPIPLNEELVRLMREAGCVNPCISLDSGEDKILNVLGKRFTVADIRQMAEWFHKYSFPFTVDLIFGAPGESIETAQSTIALMEEIQPVMVGMNFGLRIYRDTVFGRRFLGGEFHEAGKVFGSVNGNENLFSPIFFASDLKVGDYLKEVCDADSKYKLLGYHDFGGVNYKKMQIERPDSFAYQRAA